MLERNKQEVSDANNSSIMQSGRDIIINNGIGVDEVKEIVFETIKQELSNMAEEAQESFLNKLQIFSNQFISKIESSVNQLAIEKLRLPKIQIVLHNSLIGFIKTDNASIKEELVDLLLERIKENEGDTKQFIIDEAIKVVPNISIYSLYFLGALLQREIIHSGYGFMVESFLSNQAVIFKYLDMLSTLDIEYLKQINCCSLIPDARHSQNCLETLKVKYDLLFRKSASLEDINNWKSSNPEMIIPPLGGIQIIYEDSTLHNRFKLLYASKDSLIKLLVKEDKIKALPNIEKFINDLFPQLSDSEIKNHLISLNAYWQKAFEVLDKYELTGIMLTPLGKYIGNRVSEKITKRNAIPLEKFYREDK